MRGEGVIVKLQLVASWFIENCVFAVAKSNFAVTIASVSKFLLVVGSVPKHDAIFNWVHHFRTTFSCVRKWTLRPKTTKRLKVESVIDVQYHYEPTSLLAHSV